MSQQQGPGWGMPGAERRAREAERAAARPTPPPVGAMGTPVHGFAPHEAAYLHQMDVRSAIAEYPAGDKPFVGPTIGGIIMMIVGLIMLFGFFIPDIGPVVALIGAGVAVIGSIMIVVGAYRLLNALQVMYLLVRKL